MRKELIKYQRRLSSGECATDIMNDMEKEFHIPIINDKQYNLKNYDVITLYREVSKSRDM